MPEAHVLAKCTSLSPGNGYSTPGFHHFTDILHSRCRHDHSGRSLLIVDARSPQQGIWRCAKVERAIQRKPLRAAVPLGHIEAQLRSRSPVLGLASIIFRPRINLILVISQVRLWKVAFMVTCAGSVRSSTSPLHTPPILVETRDTTTQHVIRVLQHPRRPSSLTRTTCWVLSIGWPAVRSLKVYSNLVDLRKAESVLLASWT